MIGLAEANPVYPIEEKYHVTSDHRFTYRGAVGRLWSAQFSAITNGDFALSNTVYSDSATADATRRDDYAHPG